MSTLVGLVMGSKMEDIYFGPIFWDIVNHDSGGSSYLRECLYGWFQ